MLRQSIEKDAEDAACHARRHLVVLRKNGGLKKSFPWLRNEKNRDTPNAGRDWGRKMRREMPELPTPPVRQASS